MPDDVIVHTTTDRPDTSPVRSLPSVRARGAFYALVPDGWHMSEWRGGSCASIATFLAIDNHAWEVIVMPDDDLTLPVTGREYLTWVVRYNRWDDEADGAYESPYDHTLTLPAPHEGDGFPTGRALDWVADSVRAGHYELV